MMVFHKGNWMVVLNWVVVSNIFYIHPYLREDEPILTGIFFRWVETTNSEIFRNFQGNVAW